MGLGGAAEGGTTVLAMMILGALGLVVVVLALLLRWTTGRLVGLRHPRCRRAHRLRCRHHRQPPQPGCSPAARAEDLRRDVGAALAFDIGAGSLADGMQQMACAGDEHGWVASGYATARRRRRRSPGRAVETLAITLQEAS